MVIYFKRNLVDFFITLTRGDGMSNLVIKSKLREEIEHLRIQLSEEWKQTCMLSHPSIVILSQTLDVKINEYLKLTRI